MATINAAVERTITNKFAKSCTTCGTWVPEQHGHAVLHTGLGWRTYCTRCVPVQIKAAHPPTRRLYVEDGVGYIETPYEPDNLSLYKAFPGQRWDEVKRRRVFSLDPADRMNVLRLADELKLDVPDELRAVARTEQAERAASFPKLYPFQQVGVEWLSLQERALLADEMGLGKSVQTILSLPANARVLLVVPANVRYNWRDEFEMWRPGEFRVTILKGKETFYVPAPGEVVITSYNLLPKWLLPSKDREGTFVPADVPVEYRPGLAETILVCDEAQAFRNYKSQQTRKGKELGKLCARVWFLTGTPLPNRPEQLRTLLDTGGMLRRSFGSWKRFEELHHAYKNKWGGMEWGRPDPCVPEMLRKVMLRRTREAVLPDLPRKTYQTLTVPVNGAALAKRLDTLFEEWGDYFEVADADSALPPFEEFSKIRAELAADRIDAVTEWVEAREDEETPVIVFSAHRFVVDELAKRPGWLTITGDTSPEERTRRVRLFQRGHDDAGNVIKGMSLTITAGGVGITLTRASVMLFVDLDWTPGNNSQAEDRICRIGQTSNKVLIVRMVSDHPLDRHVHGLLAEKIARIAATVEQTLSAKIAAQLPARAGETEEEFRARMVEVDTLLADARKAAEGADEAGKRMVAKGKIGRILEKQRARATRPELPLTEERIAAVRYAFEMMTVNDSDQATLRNGIGWNQPDSCIAHTVLATGLETEDELRAAERMLVRYHRQLKASYPILFS